MMMLVIDGVLTQQIPWGFVLVGVGLALLAEVFRVPSLPLAVGIYLPITTMMPIFVGGMIRKVLEDKIRARALNLDQAILGLE